MSVTTIDATPALIVVDLQQGVVGTRGLAHPVETVVGNSAALAAAFRASGHPGVLVNATGTAPGRTDAGARSGPLPPGFADLVAELGARPGDHRVTKRTWGAFTGTGLDEHLRAAGVTQVVLAGIATSAGVESTARFAHELGYHVVLATDAMTDRSARAHDNSVQLVFPKLGECGTTAQILELLRITGDR